MIANTVLDWIYNEHGFRLTSWNQPFLTRASLQEYARAIAREGSPLTNCFGFIDAGYGAPNMPPCCLQLAQARSCAEISICSTAKWFESKSLWSGGGSTPRCRNFERLWPSKYTWKRSLQSKRGCSVSSSLFNGPLPVFKADMEAMSSVRASVEWLFGDVSNYFKFIDFKKNLMSGLSTIGKQYIVAALFRNILTCLYGTYT